MILKKPVFRGWYPLIYPFRGSDPMCDFNIFKLHQNEDLCKKLEVSILKNMNWILKKPFFMGWYPLIYLLKGIDQEFRLGLVKKPIFMGYWHLEIGF